MIRSYDNWKTSTPEPKEIYVTDCHNCKTEMFVGEKALHDCVSGEYFCSKDCVKEYIKTHLDDFIEEILDKDFSPVELEKEEIA